MDLQSQQKVTGCNKKRERNIKPLKVKLSEEAYEEYHRLKESVELGESNEEALLRSIERAVSLLKKECFSGTQIPKKNIPKKYKNEYEVTNLWKINLSSYWRLIYTVSSSEVEIVSFILDILDHKKYNKVFGYRKR